MSFASLTETRLFNNLGEASQAPNLVQHIMKFLFYLQVHNHSSPNTSLYPSLSATAAIKQLKRNTRTHSKGAKPLHPDNIQMKIMTLSWWDSSQNQSSRVQRHLFKHGKHYTKTSCLNLLLIVFLFYPRVLYYFNMKHIHVPSKIYMYMEGTWRFDIKLCIIPRWNSLYV